MAGAVDASKRVFSHSTGQNGVDPHTEFASYCVVWENDIDICSTTFQ